MENNYRSFNDLPLVLSVGEVAAILGIGLSNIYTLVRCGRIGSLRIGRQFRIPRNELRKFLDSADAAAKEST